MTMMKREQLALKIATVINIFSAIAGVAFFFLTYSKAILLDGLLSAIMVVSNIIATKISADVEKGKNDDYPLGKHTKETLYVLVRSVLMLVLIAVSLYESGSSIIQFFQGEQITEANLNVSALIVYAVLMCTGCFGLVVMFNRINKQMGNTSSVLKSEAMGSMFDGIMSLTAVCGLLVFNLVPFLKPISQVGDSILVVVMSLLYFKQPFGLFINQVDVLSYKRLHDKLEDQLEKAIITKFPDMRIRELFVSNLGNFTDVFVYGSMEGSFTVKQLDERRIEIKKIVSKQVINSIVFVTFSEIT